MKIDTLTSVDPWSSSYLVPQGVEHTTTVREKATAIVVRSWAKSAAT